jgi:hypothetical protein
MNPVALKIQAKRHAVMGYEQQLFTAGEHQTALETYFRDGPFSWSPMWLAHRNPRDCSIKGWIAAAESRDAILHQTASNWRKGAVIPHTVMTDRRCLAMSVSASPILAGLVSLGFPSTPKQRLQSNPTLPAFPLKPSTRHWYI